MSNQELCSSIENTPERLNIEIPVCVFDGICEKYVLREYQEDALKNFIYYMKYKDFYQQKIFGNNLFSQNKNHLLFNVATGGGKTLLMACIILYLHNEYGYNNFLFLSHLNSINTKTKENFFNKNSKKYLFANNVNIISNDNLYFSNNNDININISSYQALSRLLKEPKENAFNLKDVRNQKIVILADEGHHLNAGSDKDAGVYEDSVNKVLNNNSDNFLIEFTATIDWKNPDLFNKYSSKCVYKYDLKSFYESGYTKLIDLIQRDVEIDNLMLGAIILSQYRQSLFNKKLQVNIKPVILFKSKTIPENKKNCETFKTLIKELDNEKLDIFYNNIRNNENSITKNAFEYLKETYSNSLINLLKENFNEKTILSTNNESEVDNNAVLLNSLENKENKIRVIFSVNKLNEGWDVLNLFDIVKLYKTQNEAETVMEAQLIGRGARYCPFDFDDKDKYKRKFGINEDLNILEQLYFHSSQDNITIAKLKKELENLGILFQTPKKIEIKMKDSSLIRLEKEKVFYNKKEKKKLISEDFNIFDIIKEKFNCQYYKGIEINSNKEIVFSLMNNINDIKEKENNNDDVIQLVRLSDIDYYIKWNAIIDNTKYNFEKLYKRLELKSFDEFIEKLDILEIKVKNWKETNKNKYLLYSIVLNDIYDKILGKELKSFIGSNTFETKLFKNVFKEHYTKKLIHEEVECKEDYIAYDKGDLTSEEKAFLEFFNLKIYKELQKDYIPIDLVRNEKDLKLFLFENGVGFEPDFILFLTQKNTGIKYQVYIEPKGDNLIYYDNDKNEFLKQINQLTKENKIKLNCLNDNNNDNFIVFDRKNYKLVGLQFYNSQLEAKENRMEKEFEKYVINDI